MSECALSHVVHELASICGINSLCCGAILKSVTFKRERNQRGVDADVCWCMGVGFRIKGVADEKLWSWKRGGRGGCGGCFIPWGTDWDAKQNLNIECINIIFNWLIFVTLFLCIFVWIFTKTFLITDTFWEMLYIKKGF